MESTSLSFQSNSETVQANTNPDNQQPNLDITQRGLLLYRMLKEVFKDRYPNEDNPDNEVDPDDDDDSEGEEDDDDDDIPELEITDDDGWDEDFDENGLRYWVPDEIWIPIDDLDAEEEIEPVDTKIVPIGWSIDNPC